MLQFIDMKLYFNYQNKYHKETLQDILRVLLYSKYVLGTCYTDLFIYTVEQPQVFRFAIDSVTFYIADIFIIQLR